jgi:hypothetical protein
VYLLSILSHLQWLNGDKPILVPVDTFALLLGVTPRMVSDYRKYLKKDGYLVEIEPSVRKKAATKFYFQESPYYFNKDYEDFEDFQDSE